ncbi:MAG: transcriptional regulator [Halolamina sp.]|uniref:transcriptional regulator n=1 Tax=Halolamina sp. TaxID=1940283 RepID=UPI002FC36B5D
MAKYSTGSGGGGDDGDACELCGSETASLRKANVAGAELLVCADCEPMGENRHTDRKKREKQGGTRDNQPANRKKRAARNTAKVMDASGGTDDWVENTEYDGDSLPYLVSGYGDEVTEARQAEGLTIEEVAEEVEIDESDLLAVEEGRAIRADVGGSVIGKLQQRFDIQLAES